MLNLLGILLHFFLIDNLRNILIVLKLLFTTHFFSQSHYIMVKELKFRDCYYIFIYFVDKQMKAHTQYLTHTPTHPDT